jgi:hypothetical protein
MDSLGTSELLRTQGWPSASLAGTLLFGSKLVIGKLEMQGLLNYSIAIRIVCIFQTDLQGWGWSG